MYGLRTAGPVALGSHTVCPGATSSSSTPSGAIVWAAVFSTLGYVFGKAIAAALGQVTHYEAQAVIAILVIGLAWFAHHRWRRKREKVIP